MTNELKMFGCSRSDLEAVRAEMHERDAAFYSAVGIDARMVASMLSDAQEEMAMGRTESARQTINRAKWVLERIVRANSEPTTK